MFQKLAIPEERGNFQLSIYQSQSSEHAEHAEHERKRTLYRHLDLTFPSKYMSDMTDGRSRPLRVPVVIVPLGLIDPSK